MERIVLDTNCLIMAVSSKSQYSMIWTDFLKGKYVLCITNEIIEEYVEVLSRNINERLAAAVVYTILTKENILRIDPHFHFNLISQDPDDNKFVDCAFASGAKLIVTEDHHFDVLKEIEFPKLNVVGIDEFMQFLKLL